MQANAIENLRMGSDFVVRSDGAIQFRVHVENAGHAADPGQDAILLREDGASGTLIRIDTGVAGGIARGPVFLERVLDDGGDASAIPVHVSRSSAKTMLDSRLGCPVERKLDYPNSSSLLF